MTISMSNKRIQNCQNHAEVYAACSKVLANIYISPIGDRKELIESLAKDEIPYVLQYLNARFPNMEPIRQMLQGELDPLSSHSA